MGFSLKKMFTPPKNKTPWQAMTQGSSSGALGSALEWLLAPGGKLVGTKKGEGWAAKYAPGGKLGWVGPVGTMAMGAIPVVGPALSALGGAMGTMGDWAPGTGYQGSNYGSSNWMSTILGGLVGYGAGGIGRGISQGIGSALSSTAANTASSTPAASFSTATPYTGNLAYGAPVTATSPSLLSNFSAGFGQGTSTYGMNSPVVKSFISNFGDKSAIGGGVGQSIGGGVGGSAGSIATTEGAKAAGGFNLGSLAKNILGSGLISSTMAGGTPQYETDFPERARNILQMPNLQEAISGIRQLAVGNPGELIGPASDEFINSSLRQFRDATSLKRNSMINAAQAQGRTEKDSGSLQRQLREFDIANLQQEKDFITQTNESRRIADVGIKVNAVSQYFNVSLQQAADLLAIEGFVEDNDARNYMQQLQDYQGMQKLLGDIGSQLLG